MVEDDKQELTTAREHIKSIVHPFEADTDDHAESPPESYAHAAVLLDLIAEKLGKIRSNLAIYDPYYCTGAMERHLNKTTHVLHFTDRLNGACKAKCEGAG